MNKRSFSCCTGKGRLTQNKQKATEESRSKQTSSNHPRKIPSEALRQLQPERKRKRERHDIRELNIRELNRQETDKDRK